MIVVKIFAYDKRFFSLRRHTLWYGKIVYIMCTGNDGD